MNDARLNQRPLSLDVTSHYDGSADCLPPQEMQVSPREGEDEVDLIQKKGKLYNNFVGKELIILLSKIYFDNFVEMWLFKSIFLVIN